MLSVLKRADDGIARGEAALAAFILLVMIVLAATQALLYNIATRAEVELAQQALLELDWIDAVLQKGTLWLAFLGASLATHKDQHIAIDALHRVMSPGVRRIVRIIVTIIACVTCFYLARVFFSAALAAQERPLEYELLGDDGPIHICEGTARQIADADLSRPALFCEARRFFAAIGSPIETPVGALQLIVPVMFLWMCVRFGARAIGLSLQVAGILPPDSVARGAEGETGSA
jgi:TRAP-type C4-dicarboxylate transport system permease small subunit